MEHIRADYCVAFIDILGFKAKTCEFENLKRYSAAITAALETMRSYNPEEQTFKNLSGKAHIITLQVADSLIFIFPKSFENLFLVVRRLAILQFRLALDGIYLRGSINSGLMYVDEARQMYFGEAWNKAVIGEESAESPRILLENYLADFLTKYLRENFNEGVLEFITDTDGEYILPSYNSLTILKISGARNLSSLYSQFLNKLSENVKENIGNKNVLNKYLWICEAIINQPYKKMSELSEVTKTAESIKQQINNHLLNL